MMPSETRRFFVSLLPPQSIQDEVTEIKLYFAKCYQSCHALKSPPHVTLQPPFQWECSRLADLEASLANFAASYPPVPITLDGFGVFPPKVIYVNVIKTPELMGIQPLLMADLETNLNIIEASKQRSFSPHMTVAFRDLTRENFRKSWAEFEHQPFHHEFVAQSLTLLQHDGTLWNVLSEFPLAQSL